MTKSRAAIRTDGRYKARPRSLPPTPGNARSYNGTTWGVLAPANRGWVLFSYGVFVPWPCDELTARRAADKLNAIRDDRGDPWTATYVDGER